MRPPAVLVVLAVPIIALAAVLVTRAVAGPTGTGKVAANTIVIKNFAFVPATLTVKRGTVLTVKNSDGVTHTFTAKNRGFNTGDIRSGGTKTVTLDQPGTIAFFCQIHNNMTGTLKVTG